MEYRCLTCPIEVFIPIRANTDSRYRGVGVPPQVVSPEFAFFPNEEVVVPPSRLLMNPSHLSSIVNRSPSKSGIVVGNQAISPKTPITGEMAMLRQSSPAESSPGAYTTHNWWVVALFETDIAEQREHTGSFMYLSIPYFAVREYWLSRRSKQWLSVPATVESTHRSRGGYKETIKGELWYSYSLNGEEHSGRVVRDGAFSPGKINVLTEEHERGQTIYVRVNPHDPSQSYYPSGLGFVEPLIIGVIGIGGTLLLTLMVIGIVLSAITGR